MTLNRRTFLLGCGLTALAMGIKPQDANALKGNGLNENGIARSCRPDDPLAALMQGNARFATAWSRQSEAPDAAGSAEAMASLWLDNCFLPSDVLRQEQAPWATLLTCADSRVSPAWIFDAAPADLFVIRSAGNTAFDEAIASIEYSVGVLECPLVMVMGHSSCGAVQAARQSESLSPMLEKLLLPIRASITPGEALQASIEANARSAARHLIDGSPIIAKAVTDNKLTIVSSYFDIATGTVTLA